MPPCRGDVFRLSPLPARFHRPPHYGNPEEGRPPQPPLGSFNFSTGAVSAWQNLGMDLDSIRRSADGIAAVIADIDAGKLGASADQRAYLTGALDTLRTLLDN